MVGPYPNLPFPLGGLLEPSRSKLKW